jgi:hypothetical protein
MRPPDVIDKDYAARKLGRNYRHVRSLDGPRTLWRRVSSTNTQLGPARGQSLDE